MLPATCQKCKQQLQQLFEAEKKLPCWKDPREGQTLWHQTDPSKVFLTNFEKKAFRVFNFEEYVTPYPPK